MYLSRHPSLWCWVVPFPSFGAEPRRTVRPVGTTGNSPAIYRWEWVDPTNWSPVGTTELYSWQAIWLNFHHPLFAGRLVNSQDYFDGFEAFTAADGGIATLLQRLNQILNLAAVSAHIQGQGIS